MNKKVIAIIFSIVIIAIGGYGLLKYENAKNGTRNNSASSSQSNVPEESQSASDNAASSATLDTSPDTSISSSSNQANSDETIRIAPQYATNISFVGPGGNVPKGAPSNESFKLFAIPVPKVLSRSAQPSLKDFQWLKENGWKSIVDFREDGEKGNQYAIDSKLPGFNGLGFNFLSIPIKDGSNPSENQADQFLSFVTDPKNQPVHVHCAAGIGRTGVAIALYRYSVQSWPMDKAIEEGGLFTKNIPSNQRNWLLKWAQNHLPGSYAKT
jgi:protein tyrosine phosphatase (PTP) superfamily phosphohydrolase (DUF442 family)